MQHALYLRISIIPDNNSIKGKIMLPKILCALLLAAHVHTNYTAAADDQQYDFTAHLRAMLTTPERRRRAEFTKFIASQEGLNDYIEELANKPHTQKERLALKLSCGSLEKEVGQCELI